MGTSDESCYLSLPAATRAIGGHGHLEGIRRFTPNDFRQIAPRLYQDMAQQVPPGQDLCVAAFTGHFTVGRGVEAFGQRRRRRRRRRAHLTGQPAPRDAHLAPRAGALQPHAPVLTVAPALLGTRPQFPMLGDRSREVVGHGVVVVVGHLEGAPSPGQRTQVHGVTRQLGRGCRGGHHLVAIVLGRSVPMIRARLEWRSPSTSPWHSEGMVTDRREIGSSTIGPASAMACRTARAAAILKLTSLESTECALPSSTVTATSTMG